ncbi:uncharacterized protein LOC132051808 isoform X1 [Lycium ferocissimum]|uniref:uncharacterized protein LOC132051808 isoform X1 n=1 Tax=Lycium ferocissimum TaxID=112874 RepID=UPI0028164C8A|nr:uncharacterized protein LOC132051808 isoform X1 [Lycium ferocissimum]
MAEALFELEQVLISRKEALTSEEAKLLNSWKQNAVRDFGIGATGASIATWLVTRRLNNLIRMNLTVGVGFYYGIRRFAKCLDSEVEQILSQHGTRLQTGLAEMYCNVSPNIFSVKLFMTTIEQTGQNQGGAFGISLRKILPLLI